MGRQMANRTSTYLKKNYQWIIGTLLGLVAILVAIIVVPWGINLARDAEAAKEKAILKSTSTYYFTPQTKVETAGIKDGADCWESISSNRSDAYRCSVGNLIYDPCFYQTTWNYADCPPSPTQHQIITIAKKAESGPTVNYEQNRPQIPWYIKLENGVGCKFYTGATDFVADGRIDYGCEDKRWLSLPISDKNTVQSIKCYSARNERIEMCNIKEAWY